MDILNTKIKSILTEKTTKIRPENIKSGVNILGITGTLTSLDTSDATATSSDIVEDKTAYVNGQKVTGTLESTSGIYSGSVEGDATISEYNSVDYGMQVLEINTPIEDEDWLSGTKYVIDDTADLTVIVPSSQVASSVGLTANKLKKDERVLGVTGTYEGGASEYNAKVVTTAISTSYTNFPTAIRFIKEFPAINLTGFTTCQSFFNNCNYLEKVELFDTSNCTSFENMFHSCERIKTIPQFNTSKVTTFKQCFSSCLALENVPILNTSKASPYSMSNMFQSCSNLTNESLNNILYMCAHVGSGSAYRNLAYIGLTQSQATICTGLSNWASAQAAGWTTGY